VNAGSFAGLAGLAGLCVAALISCVSPSGSPSDAACESVTPISLEPPADATASSQSVEVILVRECSACHAAPPGSGDLTLPLASQAWVANLVNQPSHENPGMMLVRPGDPANSWLMQKLACNQCAFASTCDARLGCGICMPFGRPLPLADLTTVFVWIRAGASR
jgi:hypothetical protein